MRVASSEDERTVDWEVADDNEEWVVSTRRHKCFFERVEFILYRHLTLQTNQVVGNACEI